MVQFLEDMPIGTRKLVGGQATFSVTLVTGGTHTFVAKYSGDSNYPPLSASYVQQVNRIVDSLNLIASATTSVWGQELTFRVQIGPPTPAGVASPSGRILFLDGADVIGTVIPSAANATFQIVSLAVRSHKIAALYSGDNNWYAIQSSPVAVTVRAAATSTELIVAPGWKATLTASVSVTPPGLGIPAGSVQFMDTATNTVLGTVELSGKTSASISIDAWQAVPMAGHAIRAVYSGSPAWSASTSNPVGIPVLASAAGPPSANLAPDQMVSLFGYQLADTTAQAGVMAPPNSLAGSAISVIDHSGVTHLAGLSLISPSRVDFVMPAGLASGMATVNLTKASARVVGPIQVGIAAVAPGLFTTSQIVRVAPDGTQTIEGVPDGVVAMGSDTIYLTLYATGIRNRSDLKNVSCRIDGQGFPVRYAGPQAQFAGLDQVVVLLPESLKGTGQRHVSIVADGVSSNDLMLTFP
jgi:uncharacterized protein (TIGR03437 family)